jgi:Protein of unknown function (DUF3105)
MARQDQTQRRGHRARRRWTKGAAIAGVVVIAVVVGYFAYRAQADLPGQKFSDQGNLHVQTVTDPHEPYNSTPPTSGPHLPYIAPWGVHTKPIVNELQVHNLEDGGVMVQYNCECPDLAEKLAGIARRYDRYVVLAPYPTMKSRIALTAWTRLEALDEFDASRIERFIKAYRGIDHHPR